MKILEGPHGLDMCTIIFMLVTVYTFHHFHRIDLFVGNTLNSSQLSIIYELFMFSLRSHMFD